MGWLRDDSVAIATLIGGVDEPVAMAAADPLRPSGMQAFRQQACDTGNPVE